MQQGSPSRIGGEEDHIDNPFQLPPEWDSTYPSHTAWPGLPSHLLTEVNWWETDKQESLKDGTTTDIASTSKEQSSSHHPPLPDKKRPRVESVIGVESKSSATSLPPEAVIKAKKQLIGCYLQEVNMSACDETPCDDRHQYAMTNMGPDPLDYFGGSLRVGEFQAKVVEPAHGKDLHNWTAMPGPMDLTIRPPGKSLHLIFTQYPTFTPPFSLSHGFALLMVCRRRAREVLWEPQCFVAFEDPSRKPTKISGSKIGFVGNLDRCNGVQNGKRIWGQRTSHIRHSKDRAKPVRIAPKGSTKSYGSDDTFCIMISLHDLSGLLMSDVHGEFCIAQTNPFRFQEKRTDTSLPHLLDVLGKLTISQRITLATNAPNRDITNLLLTNASETQEAAGLISARHSEELPPTACPLSEYLSKDSLSPLSSDYKNRLKSVAKWMGNLHTNPVLISKYASFLKSGNISAARGRFMALVDTNVQEHQDWLTCQGVTLNINAVSDRAQILGSIMSERKYKSKWIVCVGNIYPDSIFIDTRDEKIVYCLAEEGRESLLELCDRLAPLARLAFTSRLSRKDIEDILLTSYKIGFDSTNKENEQAIDLERFWLLLHAMRLDFFLYWVKFKNELACRRIQSSLFEDDEYFHDSFFTPDRFKKLNIS